MSQRNRQELRTFREHSHEIWAVAVSPDGKHLVAADMDPAVRMWNATTGQLIRMFHSYRQVMFGLEFSPDGRHLAAVGIDDGPPPNVLIAIHAFRGHVGAIGCLAVSKDGKILATGSADKTVKLWGLSQKLCAGQD